MARRRPKTSPQARYDAAGTGRRIATWSPPSSGPNRAVTGLQKIRDRARDSSRNDWVASSSIQKWTTALVGVGILPRWEDEAITARWEKWVPDADADGVLDFYGLETLVTRSWLDAGEVFVRARWRHPDLPLSAPLQVQLLEADFCPLHDADVFPGMPAGNRMRSGIELNKYGRRVAYWFYKEHPGDGGSRLDSSQMVRVPASQVAHVFEPLRPGQLRGVSSLAPVLVRLRSSVDMEDAVLDRQKLANLFTMFITRQMPPDTADIDIDPLTGLPAFYDSQGKALASLEPGMSQELMPGEDVKFANPPEAGVTFSDYMRTTHTGTAAGQGLPYELMSGELRDVSDRAMRIVINEFRRFARQRQWQILIPQLCQRVVRWWAQAEVLAGGLSLGQADAAAAPVWSPHGWEYIHPTQDAEGKKIEIGAGLRSRSEVIADRGDDPRKVDEERAEDLKRSKKLGLEPEPPKPPPAPKPTPKAIELEELTLRRARAEVTALERPASPSSVETILAGVLGHLASLTAQQTTLIAQQTATLSHVATLAARESTVNVTNEVPVPEVNVTNEVPAPIVNVTNEVPAPVVNVANEVNVTPEVNVNMPDRETTSVIERDSKGDIVNVTQVEKTLQ